MLAQSPPTHYTVRVMCTIQIYDSPATMHKMLLVTTVVA